MKKVCFLFALCIFVSNFCLAENLEGRIRKETKALNMTINSFAKKPDNSGTYTLKGFTTDETNISKLWRNLGEDRTVQVRLIMTQLVKGSGVNFEFEISPIKTEPSEISSDDEPTKVPDKSPTESLFEAAANGHAEMIKELVHNGADIHAMNSEKQKIMQVADDEVMPLLIELGADSNVTDSSGRPLLVQLIRGDGDAELISKMLTAGADPNIENKEWGTALENAALICKSEIVEALIKAGAKVNTKGSSGIKSMGLTAMGLRAEDCTKTAEALIKGGVDVKNGAGGDALLRASKNRGYSKYLQLLIKAGADVNVRSGNGSSPLINATFVGDIEMVKTLLAAGADANAKLQDGSTALDIANENKNAEIIKLLQSASKAK
jgi:ankyrin repeat protein